MVPRQRSTPVLSIPTGLLPQLLQSSSRNVLCCFVAGIIAASFQARAESSSDPRTLQSFGIQLRNGQPVYPLPSNVTLGLFDPDPLLDVAYFGDSKVQVWKNLGNGTFGTAPVWERAVTGVERLEWRKSRYLTGEIFDPNSWGELVLHYEGGRSERVTHEQILSRGTTLPAGGFGALSPMSPPLSFTEVWRSEPNPQTARYVQIADIDNDGNTEVAYCFYNSVNDSGRLTLFENYGNDLYRIEWDSLMQSGTPMAITDIDNDGHKEIVVIYTIPGMGVIGFLECYGEGLFRFYKSNIGFYRTPFKVQQTDVDHDGVREITVLTSNSSLLYDQTAVHVAEFSGKGQGPDGWLMSFNPQYIARYQGYTFEMAVGQMDGEGWDDIVPAGGSFGVYEPVNVDYLSFSNGSWITRSIYTGLQSGTGAVMFVNLDADTTMEFVSGAPGPIGHGSMYALKHFSNTTWSVLWADSTLRNAPLHVNSGHLNGDFVVAGANSYNPNNDTIWSQLHAYRPSGTKHGTWLRDSASIQQFYLLDIDNDNKSNLIFAQVSHFLSHYLMDYESDTVVVGVIPPGRLPQLVELFQNYPNPFNPKTTITFQVPTSTLVDLRVYDVLGREVTSLVNEVRPPGGHTVTWDASSVASGVYFYRLWAGSSVLVRKMMVLR